MVSPLFVFGTNNRLTFDRIGHWYCGQAAFYGPAHHENDHDVTWLATGSISIYAHGSSPKGNFSSSPLPHTSNLLFVCRYGRLRRSRSRRAGCPYVHFCSHAPQLRKPV